MKSMATLVKCGHTRCISFTFVGHYSMVKHFYGYFRATLSILTHQKYRFHYNYCFSIQPLKTLNTIYDRLFIMFKPKKRKQIIDRLKIVIFSTNTKHFLMITR